jgi:hypothetical protein
MYFRSVYIFPEIYMNLEKKITGSGSGNKMSLGQRYEHERRTANPPDEERMTEAHRGRLLTVRGAEKEAAAANWSIPVCSLAASGGRVDQRHGGVRAREGGAIWGRA